MKCILCGGNHEPSVAACTDNEAGMDKRIAEIGAKRFNRLSQRVQSARNLPNLKAIQEHAAFVKLRRE